MIPNKVIDIFRNKCYVLHPSLLPLYRGCSPISACLLNGDNTTGISIVEMSKQKFDAGSVIL